MDKEKIGGWIAHHEGVREQVYLDSADSPNPTIGIGFNLNREDAPDLIQNLGLDYDKVVSGEQQLNQDQINYIFQHDLDVAINDARNTFSNFDELPEDKQLVLVDMSFNLGQSRLSGFENMIDAVEREDWQKAADEMVDSKWYEDVQDRGVHNVDVMRGGFSEVHENYVSNYVDFSTTGTEGVTINDSPFTIIENPDVKNPLLDTFDLPSRNDSPFTIIENPDVRDPLLETFNLPSPTDIYVEAKTEETPLILETQNNEWNTQLNDPWAENTTNQESLNDIWVSETKNAWDSEPIIQNPINEWDTSNDNTWSSNTNETTIENHTNDWNSSSNDTWSQTSSNDTWNTPNDPWTYDTPSQNSSNDS
jgi:GH24 family phage-related lysozyme (muramidase)